MIPDLPRNGAGPSEEKPPRAGSERRDGAGAGIVGRQVLSATVTFCAGVIFITLARLLFPAYSGMAGVWSDGMRSFWSLCGIVVAATALYLALRRDEGDFRALVLVALGLFGISEIAACFSDSGSCAARAVAPILFRIAAGVYSMLAVFAFLTCPPPAGDALRAAPAIGAAATGIVSFSGTAAVIWNDAALRRAEEIASMVLIGLTAAYIILRLYASTSGTGSPAGQTGPGNGRGAGDGGRRESA
ncbi:MAG: hypothetical protein N3A38_11130 [Planctomycetota bacterium]|nr:hypothetical protein [Planctomycetota bacterium]